MSLLISVASAKAWSRTATALHVTVNFVTTNGITFLAFKSRSIGTRDFSKIQGSFGTALRAEELGIISLKDLNLNYRPCKKYTRKVHTLSNTADHPNNFSPITQLVNSNRRIKRFVKSQEKGLKILKNTKPRKTRKIM